MFSRSRAVPISALLLTTTLACLSAPPSQAAQEEGSKVWILMKDGQAVEGTIGVTTLKFAMGNSSRDIKVRDILSYSSGEAATPDEASRITAGLAAVAGTDRAARETAVADLTDIGLPVMSPLLAAYKDTDAHEPNPLYHLFARIVPGYADSPSRMLDMVRMANGDTFRGKLVTASLDLDQGDKGNLKVALGSIRRLAVRRDVINKTFTLDALRHCTPIEFLDTGVAVTPTSAMDERTDGYVRLSFDIDGWSSDADGIKVPGPNYKTNLVDGFPFGATVGRVGPKAARWLAGRHVTKHDLGMGRLYFAVNDNGHWQNNIGSFRVKLHVTDAYDLGDPL
jgi:hypothetical protein